MAEFTVGGQDYRSGKMDAFTQFHVARRLAPIFSAIKAAADMGKTTSLDATIAGAEALSTLSDEQCNYVLAACLTVTQRKQGAAWAPLRVQGRMQFEDVDVTGLTQIAWKVLEDNFTSFFQGMTVTPPVTEQAPKA